MHGSCHGTFSGVSLVTGSLNFARTSFLAKIQNPFSVDDIPTDILNDFQSLLDDPEDVPDDRGDGKSFRKRSCS